MSVRLVSALRLFAAVILVSGLLFSCGEPTEYGEGGASTWNHPDTYK
jgi:hypothetical protein